MDNVTVGDIREKLDQIRVGLDELAKLLSYVNSDAPMEVIIVRCPPLINPAGRGCDLQIFGPDDLPITVGDVRKSVKSMGDWVGNILTVVEGLNQGAILPPREGRMA